MLSVPHMIVLFVLVLVIFGPQKLPELARTLGKLMADFRKASTDFKGAFEEEMRNIERQNVTKEREREAAAATAAAIETPQPATQGTAPGVETVAAATDTDSDVRATEALVVSPVAESVARSENGQEHYDTAAPETATPPAADETPDASKHDTSHDRQPA